MQDDGHQPKLSGICSAEKNDRIDWAHNSSAHERRRVCVEEGIADKPLTDSELTRIELVDIQDDRSEPQIKATFLNHYSHDVHLFWSSDEKLIHQGVIEADSHINLATYAGHEFLAAMNQDGSGELLRWTAHGDKSVDVVHLGIR